MEKMKSQRLLSSIIYYQILIRKFFWIGQKNFLALNYYSKEESVIFISDGEVKKITSAQISSDINDRGNIYKGTLNRSNNLLVSFGGPGILFHCIGEGGVGIFRCNQLPGFSF